MSETDLPADLFSDLACPWHKRFLTARARFAVEFPQGGYGVALIGRHAWAQMPDEHKAAAMDTFFTDYWMRLRDEEHEERLARAAKNGTSYMEPGDPADLWTYIHETKGDPEEIEVPRKSLINVLSELELLQHRLASIELGKAMDQANANDSGESK